MKRVLSFVELELDTSHEDNRKIKFLQVRVLKFLNSDSHGGACAQGWAHCFLQVQGIMLYGELYARSI